MSGYMGNEPVTITDVEETAYAMRIDQGEQDRSDLVAIVREMWAKVIQFSTGRNYTQNNARGETISRSMLEYLLNNPDHLDPSTDRTKWSEFDGVARVFLYTE